MPTNHSQYIRVPKRNAKHGSPRRRYYIYYPWLTFSNFCPLTVLVLIFSCWNIELARVTGNILQLKCLSSSSCGGNSHFASEVTHPPIFDQKRRHHLGSGVTSWLNFFTFGCLFVVLLYKCTNLKDTAGQSASGHPREKQSFFFWPILGLIKREAIFGFRGDQSIYF